MSAKKPYVDSTFLIGAGAYFLMVLIVLYYPAWIISLSLYQVGCLVYGDDVLFQLYLIGGFLIGCFILSALMAMSKTRLLVLIYGITLYPFLCQLKWQFTYPGYSPYPLPWVDWIPFI